MKTNRRTLTVRVMLAALLIGMSAVIPPAHADIRSYAIVLEDGSLKIGGWRIHLYGIHIPSDGQFCGTTTRGVRRCGSRAFLALSSRIRGFVRCQPQSRNGDGSLNAICFVAGAGSVLEPDEDLGAYLLSRGLAVALPDAPFEYVTLEKIARTQHQGIWHHGFRRFH